MGWLNSEKPPEKWSASFFKLFVEKLRTAVNFLDENNFPNGIYGSVINDKSIPLSKLSGMEFHETVVAVAEPHPVTSTSLVNVGGFLVWDTVWGQNVRLCLEVIGGSSSANRVATFELHGVDGVLTSVSDSSGEIKWLRSQDFDPPTAGQTLLVKVKTSNSSYPAMLLSARLIIKLK